MSIAVVNVGTPQSTGFDTLNTFSWTLSPTPTAGNAIIIPWSYVPCGTNSVPTPTCTDNQGNTYTLVGISQNTSSGAATPGGTNAACFLATGVASSGGSFTVSVNSVTGDRASLRTNHLEVSGLGSLDQVGTSNSGNTQVSATSATATGANTQAADLVVAIETASSTTSFGVPGSDPPLTGYTSIYHGSFSTGASNNLGGYGDAGYKVLSALETSSATWSSFANPGYASALVVTFKPAVTGLTLNLTGQAGAFSSGTLAASGGAIAPAAAGFRQVPGPGISPSYQHMFLGRQRNLSTLFNAADITVALTGQSSLFSAGTVGVNLGGNVTLALTGSAIISTAGALLAAIGNDLTLSLTGQAAIFSAGALVVTSGSNAVAQPQTSGSFNVTVWDTRHVVDRAYGAIRVRPQQITPEMIQIALDLLGLTLQDLVNDSAPLWTLEKVLVTLNQGQRAYTLPTATNDVDKALYRTLSNVTPATILDTPSSYFFDFGVNPDGSDNATYVSSASISWASSAVPVIIQSSPDATTWQNVGKSGLTQLGSGLVWYDIDTTRARRYWQIVPGSSGSIAITSASLYNTPSDIEMSRLNKDDYWNLPNKAFQGRPLQFWLDRQLTPVMQLWPSPDFMASENLMVVYRKRYIMDVGSLQQTVEVPSRWFMAIIFLLAEALSWTTPEADPTACELVRPKAAAMLRRAWLEERDRSPIKFNANIREYTR